MPDYEIEVTRTIWNNKLGKTIIVKPDSDSLGLIDIKQEDRTITITTDEAVLLSAALLATATEVEQAI